MLNVLMIKYGQIYVCLFFAIKLKLRISI